MARLKIERTFGSDRRLSGIDTTKLPLSASAENGR
jgi:hypothetical protein